MSCLWNVPAPQKCAYVSFLFDEYIEPLASIFQECEFNLVFTERCLILVEQSLQNLVPTNNWGIIPYLCWLELMFSCAAFDMRYVRSCSTLSPVLEDKMTYGGGLWLYWRWTEYWGNCHINFPTSVPPNINIRFVC